MQAPTTEVNEQTNNQTYVGEPTATFLEREGGRWLLSSEERIHLFNVPILRPIFYEVERGGENFVWEVPGGCTLKWSYYEEDVRIEYEDGRFCLCWGEHMLVLRVREPDGGPTPLVVTRENPLAAVGLRASASDPENPTD